MISGFVPVPAQPVTYYKQVVVIMKKLPDSVQVLPGATDNLSVLTAVAYSQAVFRDTKGTKDQHQLEQEATAVKIDKHNNTLGRSVLNCLFFPFHEVLTKGREHAGRSVTPKSCRHLA